MTLYLGTITGRDPCNPESNLRKQSEDSLADPVYRAMRRSDPHRKNLVAPAVADSPVGIVPHPPGGAI